MALKENILEVVGGPHVAAIATVDGKLPAVRFMVLNGFPDMTFVGGTMKASKKVAQLKKNPNVAISTWSGKEFSDPYVEMRAKGKSMKILRPRRNTGTRCLNSISNRWITLIMLSWSLLLQRSSITERT